MSFIGIVTRKDKNTGVTLRAKIVTPSKKKSITKDFPVKVKAQEADDLWCCYVDSANAKALLERMRNDEDDSINTSLPFHQEGKNGTTLTYKLSDGLEKYIDESGMLSAPPKFGEQDAVGNILITASKNESSVSVRINIRINAITANDVLQTVFNDDVIWNLIKAKSDTAVNTDRNALVYDLNLKTNYTLNEILKAQQITKKEYVDITTMITEANAPVFEWTIEKKDNNGESTNLLKADGTLTRPSYKDACKIYREAADTRYIRSDDTEIDLSKDIIVHTRYILFMGYTVKCVILLNDTDSYTKTIGLSCNIKSKLLTNNEMAESVVTECIAGSDPILYVEGFKTKNIDDCEPDGGIEKHFYAIDTSEDNERSITLNPGEIYCIRTINIASAGILKSEELYFTPEKNALYEHPDILKANNIGVANTLNGYIINSDGSQGVLSADDAKIFKTWNGQFRSIDDAKYQVIPLEYKDIEALAQKRIQLKTSIGIANFATSDTAETGNSDSRFKGVMDVYVRFIFNLIQPEEPIEDTTE